MLLALDTATTTASIALYDLQTGQLAAELTWEARRRQTQDLLPALQDLMRLVDLAPAALSALAVTTGPGSFTGVRIAISTAKGIALGLPQAPRVVGIPTLSVTAAPWIELAGRTAGGAPANAAGAAQGAGLDAAGARAGAAAGEAAGEAAGAATVAICAAIQAGRGRYNWVWYTGADPLYRPGVEDHHAGTVEDFVAALAAHEGVVWLVGEVGADLAAAHAAAPALHHVHVVDRVSSQRRAGQLARLGALHLAGGCRDTIESLQPLYLRNP
jgi:tRNA threonylcarbamoyladenosine biosynthesis protein TsaB